MNASYLYRKTKVKDDANAVCEMSRILSDFIRTEDDCFNSLQICCYFVAGCRHIPEGGIQKSLMEFSMKTSAGRAIRKSKFGWIGS